MNLHRQSRSSRGFTIIELCVAIVILCILVALVALSYSGVQAKNRNAERQTDIDTLKGQLESYYAQTNAYPLAAELADSKWREEHLKNLKQHSLQDPHWKADVGACTKDGKAVLAAQPAPNCYSYQVTAADGAACDNAGAPCAHYTLTANLEGGEQYVKASLN